MRCAPMDNFCLIEARDDDLGRIQGDHAIFDLAITTKVRLVQDMFR